MLVHVSHIQLFQHTLKITFLLHNQTAMFKIFIELSNYILQNAENIIDI